MSEKPTKIYNSELANKLADMESVHIDLKQASEYSSELFSRMSEGEDTNNVVNEALWIASVITLCKCFSTGIRKYKIPLEIYQNINGAEQFLSHIKDIRDKHLAHSVSDLEKIIIGAYLTETGIHAGVLSIKHSIMPIDGIFSLKKIIDFTLEYLDVEKIKIEIALDIELSHFDASDWKEWDDLSHTILDPVVAAAKKRKTRNFKPFLGLKKPNSY